MFANLQAFFGPPLLIESHRPIYAADTLVVAAMALVPERNEGLPEPPARVVVDNVVYCMNDRSIGLCLLLCRLSSIPTTAARIEKSGGAEDL